MGKRTTGLLVATALVLAAYYVGVERTASPPPPTIGGSDRPLVARWHSGEIERLVLERPAAATGTARPRRVVLERAEASRRWVLRAPVRGEADRSRVEALLAAIRNARRHAELPLGDPTALGLDPPRLRLEAHTTGGDTIRLAFGRADTTGRLVHVRVDDEPVVALVPRSLFERLDLDTDALRARRLFTIDRWQVDRITVRRGEQRLQFERHGAFWRMQAPLPQWADSERVEALLTAAVGLEALAFVDDRTDSDLEALGLLPPAITITLEGGGRQETVSLSAADRRGERLARRADRPPVVRVRDTIGPLLPSSVERWRSRRLLQLDPATITSIAVAGPDGVVRARIDRRPDGRFVFTVPTEPPAPAETGAVQALLDALATARVTAVVTRNPSSLRNFGLDRPLRVELGQQGRHTRLRIGKRSPREHGWYVAREDSDEVLEVLLPMHDTLAHLWPVLRARELLALEPSAIRRLVVTDDRGTTITVVRRPDGSFSSPNGALAREAVERVLRALARLEAAEILPLPDEPADRGLDRPWRRIEAQLGTDEPARAETIVLALGVADPHGRYYARLERRTPAGVETIWCTLDRRVVDALDAVLLAPPPGARRTGVVLEGPSATAAPRTPTRSPRPEAPRRP